MKALRPDSQLYVAASSALRRLAVKCLLGLAGWPRVRRTLALISPDIDSAAPATGAPAPPFNTGDALRCAERCGSSLQSVPCNRNGDPDWARVAAHALEHRGLIELHALPGVSPATTAQFLGTRPVFIGFHTTSTSARVTSKAIAVHHGNVSIGPLLRLGQADDLSRAFPRSAFHRNTLLLAKQRAAKVLYQLQGDRPIIVKASLILGSY